LRKAEKVVLIYTKYLLLFLNLLLFLG